MSTFRIRRLQPIAIVTLRAVEYAAKPSSGNAVESSKVMSLGIAVDTLDKDFSIEVTSKVVVLAVVGSL